MQAPDSLINKYRNKTPGKYHKNPIYAAMIEKLDDSVDRICQVIKTLGIADRTIVIFYSDNGGSEPVTDNYPLMEERECLMKVGAISIDYKVDW